MLRSSAVARRWRQLGGDPGEGEGSAGDGRQAVALEAVLYLRPHSQKHGCGGSDDDGGGAAVDKMTALVPVCKERIDPSTLQ